MRAKFRRLWTAPVIALLLFAGRIGYISMRAHFVGTRQDISALHQWWTAILCFYFLLFLVSAATVAAIFREMLTLRATIESVANVFVIWLLFALASITDDPAAVRLLSTIGLSDLREWLFGFASAWVVLTMYFLLGETRNKFITGPK